MTIFKDCHYNKKLTYVGLIDWLILCLLTPKMGLLLLISVRNVMHYPKYSGRLDMQRTATGIGCRNFAVSGPETWNSLPAELRLSTLSTATFALRLRISSSALNDVPAARLILLKAALVINITIIT